MDLDEEIRKLMMIEASSQSSKTDDDESEDANRYKEGSQDFEEESKDSFGDEEGIKDSIAGNKDLIEGSSNMDDDESEDSIRYKEGSQYCEEESKDSFGDEEGIKVSIAGNKDLIEASSNMDDEPEDSIQCKEGKDSIAGNKDLIEGSSNMSLSRYLSDFKEERLLAKHVLNGAQYAVKKISERKAGTTMEILRREVEIMAKLYNPYIIRYRQAWTERGFYGMQKGDSKSGDSSPSASFELSPKEIASSCLYIQMEYCPRSLKIFYKSVHERAQRLELYTQVLKVVSYLHSKGVLHGDISRSNIFIRADDKVRIADFGLTGRFIGGENQIMDPISGGLSLYKALEGGTSLKADVFSLGVLLFETLCPFNTKSEKYDLTKKLKDGKLPESYDCYPFEDILMTMVSKDPKVRSTDEEVLANVQILLKRQRTKDAVEGCEEVQTL